MMPVAHDHDGESSILDVHSNELAGVGPPITPPLAERFDV